MLLDLLLRSGVDICRLLKLLSERLQWFVKSDGELALLLKDEFTKGWDELDWFKVELWKTEVLLVSLVFFDFIKTLNGLEIQRLALFIFLSK